MALRHRLAASLALALVAVPAAGCNPVGRPNAQPRHATASSSDPRHGAPGQAGAGDPMFPALGNAGYDIEHYDLDLTWAPAPRTLTGTVTITATALQPLSAFDLDLAGMTVDRVTVDRHPATFERQGEELVIAPERPLADGARFAVAVTYHGAPGPLPYRGGRSTDKLGWLSTSRTTYTTQEPYGAHGWFPCSDHPSDKASYTIHLAAPAGLTVVANGALTERPAGGHGGRWTYDEPAPMASY
ncbi:MAG: M1 family peptidase, partial [Actinomycetota bacterium]|nr:M1 family peptidase [Actinomycetota bacterium]